MKQRTCSGSHFSRTRLTGSLLDWYGLNRRRDLPWRAPLGETSDPYRVWVSEIMLQQTTVAAVKPYFLRFVGLWPDLRSLARASSDDVLRAWAGLGYYARARNLHDCAKALVEDHAAEFPKEAKELARLPGIGPYTAAAIAAIAFDRREAAVDGNVERVIARLFAIDAPLPEAKPAIRSKTRELVPQARPGDFAQALMDLGATICTPIAPDCPLCPWVRHCRARKLGLAEILPRRKAKPERPVRRGTAFWIERQDGAVLLRRRPPLGLLGGMMEIPSSPWRSTPPGDETEAPLRASWKKGAGRIEHSFTHFHLVLDIWRSLEIESGEVLADGDYRWVRPEHLGREALPSLMRKIVAAMM